jgi:hypothetical protein
MQQGCNKLQHFLTGQTCLDEWMALNPKIPRSISEADVANQLAQ